jgi:hypothetical protein
MQQRFSGPFHRNGDIPSSDAAGWRRFGFACSALFHLVMVVLLIVTLPRLVPPPIPPDSLAVDLVTERGGAARATDSAGPPAIPTPSAPTPQAVPPRPLAPLALAPAPVHRRTPVPLASAPNNRVPRTPKSPQPVAEDPLAGRSPDGWALNDGAGGPGTKTSISVKDFLRAQIERHLNGDVSALKSSDVVVSLHLRLAPDGSIRSADIVADPRYGVDPAFHAIADSTRRAALVAQPLQFPAGHYDAVEDITLEFHPSDIARY